MRLPLGLFLLVSALIIAVWYGLGGPVRMPPSPLDPEEKLYCVSYAPFRGEQTPLDLSTRISPEQIEDDIVRLAKLTNCVRTYSTDLGLDRVAEIAGRHGLKVMQGLWLSSHRDRSREQIETAIAIAKRHPDVVRSVVVGNEVLLRGEMTPADLAATIRRVKAEVPVPVTYADVWEFWLRHPEVYAAADFVTIHILPYWEDIPIPADQAAAHVEAIRRKVAAAYPGKEVLIGEVGWPSAGRMREGALPSPANQARVMHDVLAVAKREKFNVNVIEAFDQPWKRQLEGTVGGHWGFLDAATRDFKFSWGVPVSNHPRWPWQAAGGIVLAGAVFAAAWRRQSTTSAPVWTGVAATALISGILIGWTIENVPIESLGTGGWVRSLVMVAVAIAAPIFAAMALAGGNALPSFAQVLGRRDARPRDPVALWAGVVLAVTTVLAILVALGLVFDPRYKDFPFAPLTAAIAPFTLWSFLGVRSNGPGGLAEIVAAVLVAAAAIFIVINETVANWQALWLAAALAALAVTLARSRAAAAPG